MIISEGEMPLFVYGENSISAVTGPGVVSTIGGESHLSSIAGNTYNYFGKISRESLEKYIKEKSK